MIRAIVAVSRRAQDLPDLRSNQRMQGSPL